MENRRPRLMICSVEFVASEEVRLLTSLTAKWSYFSYSYSISILWHQVRSVLLDNPLAPPGRRPIVAIDEAQVWTDYYLWSMIIIWKMIHRLNFRFSIQTSGGPDFANTIHHRPGSGWQPPLKPGLRMSPVLKPLLVVLTLYLSGSGLCSCRLQWARQHWLKLRVHNCLTCDDEPDKHCASSGTLGVDRRHIKTFFKDPSRLNVFPQIRTVDRIASRFQNTQYLLNVSRIGSYNSWFQQLGQKLWFSVDLCNVGAESPSFLPVNRPRLASWWVSLAISYWSNIFISEGWLKDRLKETGSSCIRVRRLDGNSTADQKKKSLDEFRTGWVLIIENYETEHSPYLPLVRYVSVLFCTEVAAMGVHCPGLRLGVSLGIKYPPYDLPLGHSLNCRCLVDTLEMRANLRQSW